MGGPAGSGGLLVLGGVRGDGIARTLIYDLADLTLRDSIPKGPVFNLGDDLRSARDGRHVYFLSGDSIFKADAREAEIVVRRRRARIGATSEIAVTTDPVRLLLTEWGGAQFPGSGELQLYDGELNDLGTVSLRSDSVQEGIPTTPAMPAICINEEEDRVYVGSGVERMNFSQPAALFLVDVESLSRVATHAIGDFRTEAIHAF